MTITTFSEYTKHAAETQMASCKGAEYLDAGFIGEVGELCSLYAKSVRGDYDILERMADVRKEAGDCCWFAAMKTVEQGYDLGELIETDDLDKAHRTAVACWDEPRDMASLLREVAFYAIAMIEISDSKEAFKRNVTMFFAALSVFLDHLGFDLKSVMIANYVKLLCRKSKGQIMGSGDHREDDPIDANDRETGITVLEPDAPFCGCND